MEDCAEAKKNFLKEIFCILDTVCVFINSQSLENLSSIENMSSVFKLCSLFSVMLGV